MPAADHPAAGRLPTPSRTSASASPPEGSVAVARRSPPSTPQAPGPALGSPHGGGSGQQATGQPAGPRRLLHSRRPVHAVGGGRSGASTRCSCSTAGLSFFEVFIANAAFSAAMVAVRDSDGRRRGHPRAPALISAHRRACSAPRRSSTSRSRRSARVWSPSRSSRSRSASASPSTRARWRRGWSTRSPATGYRGLLDRVFARGQQVSGAAMLVGTVGGGLLGKIDLSLPYVVRRCSSRRSSSSPGS